jgi:hypothetical protein
MTVDAEVPIPKWGQDFSEVVSTFWDRLRAHCIEASFELALQLFREHFQRMLGHSRRQVADLMPA